MKSNLFFCIGLQKAGTSWLYHNLKVHPAFDMPTRKELHFFDGMEQAVPHFFWIALTRSDKMRNNTRHTKKILNQWWINRKLSRSQKTMLSIGLLPRRKRKIAKYKQLLESFIRQGQITGDITPAYSFLKQETIHQVYTAFPQAKVILILRDPIEREWSAAKMILLKHRGKSATDYNKEEFIHFFAQDHPRSNIPSILHNWSSIYPHHQFKIFFFDDLKNDKLTFLNSICHFLEVPIFEKLEAIKIPNPGINIPITEDLEELLYRKFKQDLIHMSNYFKDYPVNYPQHWLSKYQAKYECK